MEYYMHSKESSKIDLKQPYNISELNHFEIMGLYLLGLIDFIEIKNIYGVDTLKCKKIINNVLEQLDDYDISSSNKIKSNFMENI